MPPFLGGGQMIEKVDLDRSTWNQIPYKFEAGTPNIAQVIGLSSAIDYLNKLDFNIIEKYERELLDYAEKKLNNIPELTIYGNAIDKGPIISFNLKDIHPHDVSHLLDTYGIAIRAGHHCAQPIMKRLNVSATNRVSFYIYNTFEEIDKLVDSIVKLISLFK